MLRNLPNLSLNPLMLKLGGSIPFSTKMHLLHQVGIHDFPLKRDYFYGAFTPLVTLQGGMALFLISLYLIEGITLILLVPICLGKTKISRLI